MSYKPVQIAFERHQGMENTDNTVQMIEQSEVKDKKSATTAQALVKSEKSQDTDAIQRGKRGIPSERESEPSGVLKKICRTILDGKITSVKSNHEADSTTTNGLRRSARLTVKR